MAEWTITAQSMFLVDIGTAGGTEYEMSKHPSWMADDVMQMYEDYPGLTEGTLKNHHIHSHHNMGAFFSVTDWEQMEDRSETSNYLLMLIVNFRGEYCAKVGFRAKKSSGGDISLQLTNNTDNFGEIRVRGDEDKNVLVVVDCVVEHEELLPDLDTKFLERYKKVKANKPVVVYGGAFKNNNAVAGNGKAKQAQIGYGNNYGDSMDDWWKDEYYGYEWDTETHTWIKPAEKQKDTMAMTDEEWAKSQEETPIRDFSKEEVYVFLNALIDKAIGVNHKNPVDRLIKIGKKPAQKDAFMERMDLEGWDYFQDLFKTKDPKEYISLLTAVREVAEPICHIHSIYNDIADTADENIMDIMMEQGIS